MSQIIGHIAPHSKATDSQRWSSTDNHAQVTRDIGGVGETRTPELVEEKILRMCHDELDAVNLCIDMSRMSDEALCDKLGIDKGHFSRMRKGRAHFPTRKRLALMTLAGNYAPLQYELCRTPIIAQLRAKWERDHAEKVAQSAAGQWYGSAA